MARQRHTMTSVTWVLFAFGTVALVASVLVADTVTARFQAGFAYVLGLAVLVASGRIIAGTRERPETRLANARQGSIES